MNIKVTPKDIAVGVVATLVGAVVSSTMAPVDSYGYISSDYRQSVRTEEGSTVRDPDTVIQQQNRRNARLRAKHDEEVLHGAASDTDQLMERDARSHFRAYRHCRFRGYTRARLHDCVESILELGEYDQRS